MQVTRKFPYYLLLIRLIVSSTHINLHSTHHSNNYQDKNILQYNCLHIAGLTEEDVHEIIPYCLTEWPPSWQIENNTIDFQYTFMYLRQSNITTEQLYLWSASIDLIEEYQLYLDLKTRDMSAMESFYNCTWPRFGISCEYSLDFQMNFDASLVTTINHYYQNRAEDDSLTCYTHLECDRGSSISCLDWTEICDGYIDCANDQIDEAECWQLQLSPCSDNAFRCTNGQCVSKIFTLDNAQQYECLDRTDERLMPILYENEMRPPTMNHEDIVCNERYFPRQAKMTSSCKVTRANILASHVFKDVPKSLSSECWFALKCHDWILFAFNQTCAQSCSDGTCVQMLNKTCPPFIITSAGPISFGHVHIAYRKDDIMTFSSRLPPFICYNESLCLGSYINHSSFSINKFICQDPDELHVNIPGGGRMTFVEMHLLGTYEHLYQCNTVLYKSHSVCDHQIMYQCRNSSKCITKDRLCDGLNDCEYKDDELCSLIDGTCALEAFTTFFKCSLTQICISIKRVRNHRCDCATHFQEICEDEDFDLCRENAFHLCEGPAFENFIRRHISFYTMCDGVTELKPFLIDSAYHTDETECQNWSCNNIHTNCDGFWNCLDGSDELDCNHFDALIKCPSGHHPCVLPHTYALSCLSIEKYNDGHIDCVGATDEITVCPFSNRKFYCNHDIDEPCIGIGEFCSTQNQCMYGNKDQICNVTHFTTGYFCSSVYSHLRSPSEKFLCKQLNYQYKVPLKYFAVSPTGINAQMNSPEISRTTLMLNKNQYRSRCHQGLPLQVWMDAKRTKSIDTCLCPPSYYGDQCQYQNQRVSLTLKFTAPSDSRRLLFIIVVTLIDNSNQRMIHSSEQFTFLYVRDCHRKFNIHLLYANRSKDLSRDYFIHIDVYEKLSLTYRASFLLPLKHMFLPVHRIANVLNIPHDAKTMIDSCECVNGRCLRYVDDVTMSVFCQCDPGWSGTLCDLPRNCNCSSDSLCIGVGSNHRPICLCPQDKWGPRCLITTLICLSADRPMCENDGQCIASDETNMTGKKFFCLCRYGFSGERCEIVDTNITVTFDESVPISSVVLFHFIEAINNTWQKNGSTFKTIPSYSRSIIIRWSHPFHVAFIEMFNQNYYLLLIQHYFTPSSFITKTVTIKDRCHRFDELFNKTISQLHLLRRMKYYHLACQQRSNLTPTCFYDGHYFCFCVDFKQKRVANCFQFNSSTIHNCFGQSSCENEARCIQDRPMCPQTSACVCPTCFHGVRCQFQSNFFGLNLDAILGHHIQSHVNIIYQSSIVQMSIILTSIVIGIGLISGISSILSFHTAATYSTGCGYYLISTSIVSVLIMLLLGLKYWILIIAQMGRITNPNVLIFQCRSIDFLLYALLNQERWLSVCISIERVLTLVYGPSFDRKKSKTIAIYAIPILFLCVIGSSIHDPLNRHLLYDQNDDEHNRIWCIVRYSRQIQTLNSFFQLFHFFTPFFMNISCSLFFIIRISQRKTILQQRRPFINVFRDQLKKHVHMLLSPTILVILSIPRMILFFKAGCMKAMDKSWLPLLAYLISYLPAMLTFMIFALPSIFHKRELRRRFARHRRIAPS